jgi:hypothetical protein
MMGGFFVIEPRPSGGLVQGIQQIILNAMDLK